jgi:hypothetical protein
MGVDVILGSRLDLSSLGAAAETTKRNERGERVVQTADGREVAADLVVSVSFPFFFPCSHCLLMASFSCYAQAKGLTRIY